LGVDVFYKKLIIYNIFLGATLFSFGKYLMGTFLDVYTFWREKDKREWCNKYDKFDLWCDIWKER